MVTDQHGKSQEVKGNNVKVTEKFIDKFIENLDRFKEQGYINTLTPKKIPPDKASLPLNYKVRNQDNNCNLKHERKNGSSFKNMV